MTADRTPPLLLLLLPPKKPRFLNCHPSGRVLVGVVGKAPPTLPVLIATSLLPPHPAAAAAVARSGVSAGSTSVFGAHGRRQRHAKIAERESTKAIPQVCLVATFFVPLPDSALCGGLHALLCAGCSQRGAVGPSVRVTDLPVLDGVCTSNPEAYTQLVIPIESCRMDPQGAISSYLHSFFTIYH